MWVYTKYGFFSISKNPNAKLANGDDEFQVRARLLFDLERFLETTKLKKTILSFTGTDYAFRIFISISELTGFLAKTALDIDYDNFKNKVKDADKEAGLNWPAIASRQDAYFQCWNAMFELQIKNIKMEKK